MTTMEIAAAIVTLLGFLGLIAGLLVHWSRDRSCQDEGSVYSASASASASVGE